MKDKEKLLDILDIIDMLRSNSELCKGYYEDWCETNYDNDNPTFIELRAEYKMAERLYKNALFIYNDRVVKLKTKQ